MCVGVSWKSTHTLCVAGRSGQKLLTCIFIKKKLERKQCFRALTLTRSSFSQNSFLGFLQNYFSTFKSILNLKYFLRGLHPDESTMSPADFPLEFSEFNAETDCFLTASNAGDTACECSLQRDFCVLATELHFHYQWVQDPKQCQRIWAQLNVTEPTMYRSLQGQDVILNHEICSSHFWLNCHIKWWSHFRDCSR